MISVENFYWVLFEKLLRPAGLDCWYYYPWGTKDYYSKEEFKKPRSKSDYHHVFFHFDQEPIWSENLGHYDADRMSWSNLYAKIFANSEHSQVKNNLCKSRGFLDWYFFYHGFAALDWYRDAQHINQQYPVQNAFLSMNHVFDQRSYRLALLARLIDRDVIHKGSISFHGDINHVRQEMQNPNTKLSSTTIDLLQGYMDHLNSLPWILDNVGIDGSLSARFGHQEYRLWQSSLLHLVNETVFYDPKLHLTEKVFKPIVSSRPFVLVSTPNSLEYLRSYGFKTFGPWIDERYDQIHDPDQRLDAIAKETARFAAMTINELRNVHEQMLPILDYNKQHFFGRFREIIVKEMLSNFDRCVRIWNNGRVDGRLLTQIEDQESLIQSLLQ